MRKQTSLRMTLLAAFAVAVVLALSGCGGDDDKGSNGDTATNPGATAGATGDAAGGAAIEAGKIRSEKEKAQEAKAFSKEPPPIQIQSGNESGVKVNKPTAIVVRTTPEMRKLRKRVYSAGNNSDVWTATDFKTRQFVGVFMPESKPGSLIAITDIYQNGEVIKVKVTELTRGEGCKAGKESPNPWQVVETRTMKGKAVVDLTTQRSSPC
jgi:hypothetical protein